MKLAILVTFLFVVMMSIMDDTEARAFGFRVPMIRMGGRMGMGGRLGGRMGAGRHFGGALGIKPKGGIGPKSVLGPHIAKPVKTNPVFAPVDINGIVEPVLNAVMPLPAQVEPDNIREKEQ